MNIIIPLCGKGLRFQKHQDCSTEKHRIKIFDKEMICYVLDMLKMSIQFEDTIYLFHYIGYSLDSIVEKYPFVKTIPIDHYTRGAAETIKLGLEKILQDPSAIDVHRKSLLLDCDTYYTTDILSMFRDCDTNGVLYFEQPEEDTRNIFSYIAIQKDNIIEDIAEKKRISNHANTGAYLFHTTSDLFQYTTDIIENNTMFHNEFYTSCVIHKMIQDGHIFQSFHISPEYVIFLGTPEQVKTYMDKTYAFLLDLDGTLVNTDKIYQHVWKELLYEYNIEMTDEIFYKYIQGNNDYITMSKIFSNYVSFNMEELSNKKDMLFMKHIHSISIIPNSTDFVKKIKHMGHKIAIVTNSNRIIVEKILQYIGIYDVVDCIIVGNECEKPKPFPHPYMEALNILKISNTRAIVFEDSSAGILSAKGIFPRCIVGIYNEDCTILEKYETDLMIQDYANIDIPLLLNYEKNQLKKIKDLLVYNKNSIKNAMDFKIDHTKLKGGFIADVLSINVIMEDLSVQNCVLKLKSENDTAMSKMATMLDLYEREFYFYQNIAPYVNICIPHVYSIIKDTSFQSLGVLLENLNTPDYVLNLDLNNEHMDVSLKVIRRMAELHAKFTKKNLIDIFPFLKKHNDPTFCPSWGNYVSENWDTFKKQWSFLLTGKHLELLELISIKFNKIQEYLSTGMLTLCHGDIKSANIFYKKLRVDKRNNEISGYEPYFIDWQYIAYGKGVQDLIFFMIESFDPNVLCNYTSIFKAYYYQCFIHSHPNLSYRYEEYEQDFMIAACYFPFFVAIWFGTTSKNDLIDINFPFFFIQKYLRFIEDNIDIKLIQSIL